MTVNFRVEISDTEADIRVARTLEFTEDQVRLLILPSLQHAEMYTTVAEAIEAWWERRPE